MGNMPREAEGLLGPSRGVLGEAEDGRGARDGEGSEDLQGARNVGGAVLHVDDDVVIAGEADNHSKGGGVAALSEEDLGGDEGEKAMMKRGRCCGCEGEG